MSRNSKNARRIVAARQLPKNRSAEARKRRAAGEPASNGRFGAKSAKKSAWWQRYDTYAASVKAGNRANKEGDS